MQFWANSYFPKFKTPVCTVPLVVVYLRPPHSCLVLLPLLIIVAIQRFPWRGRNCRVISWCTPHVRFQGLPGYVRGITGLGPSPNRWRIGGPTTTITGPIEPITMDQKMAGLSLTDHLKYRQGVEKNRGLRVDIVSGRVSREFMFTRSCIPTQLIVCDNDLTILALLWPLWVRAMSLSSTLNVSTSLISRESSRFTIPAGLGITRIRFQSLVAS